MAKKKETKVEETKIDFKDKTVADVYEAQVCLALKLDTLIELFEKVTDHIEKKQKGELSV